MPNGPQPLTMKNLRIHDLLEAQQAFVAPSLYSQCAVAPAPSFGEPNPRKRVRLSKDALRKLKASHKPSGSSTSRTAPEPSRFAYTPLFFHRDSTGDEESSSELEEEDDNTSRMCDQCTSAAGRTTEMSLLVAALQVWAAAVDG